MIPGDQALLDAVGLIGLMIIGLLTAFAWKQLDGLRSKNPVVIAAMLVVGIANFILWIIVLAMAGAEMGCRPCRVVSDPVGRFLFDFVKVTIFN